MKILGISALYHDSSAALVIDGKIIAAAQEERFTRIKHDLSIPKNAMKYCLEEANIKAEDLDAVVYYDNPLLTLERFLGNVVELGYDSKDLIEKSFESMCGSKMWIHDMIKQEVGSLGKDRENLLVTKHHISHAASSFYPSPYKSAAILTIDGVGEWETTTLGVGNGNDIKLLKKIRYPHSLGLLYSAFTYFCGFKVNSGEYKLMGLAPYGSPIYYDKIKKYLIDIKSDGSYRLNLEYFDFYRGTTMTNDRFAELFGGPKRELESKITKREMDMAASVQKVVEEIIILIARYLKNTTGENNLVLAGGVALNCVANGILVKEKIFKNIWVQPAAGDAGGALGAALYATYNYYNLPRKVCNKDSQKGSYLGPQFSGNSIKEYLDNNNYPYNEYKDNSKLYEKIAQHLAEGKIIGLFNGRMEFGPRALGNRSIIGDARSKEMQSKLNLKIKFRESFRPFAPSVLEERMADYFEIDCASPYMLLVAPVKKEKRKSFNLEEYLNYDHEDLLRIVQQERSDIPAVTHVDYSARIQTVTEESNRAYYNIIKEFEKLTGYGVIVNTSFNVRGEPIVCTPKDAYECFVRTDMDILVLEEYILYKEEQPPFVEKICWREKYKLD